MGKLILAETKSGRQLTIMELDEGMSLCFGSYNANPYWHKDSVVPSKIGEKFPWGETFNGYQEHFVSSDESEPKKGYRFSVNGGDFYKSMEEIREFYSFYSAIQSCRSSRSKEAIPVPGTRN